MGFKTRREEEARGFFLHKESRMSSNACESNAILCSMMAAGPRLHNFVVLAEIENSTTMAYIDYLSGLLSSAAHRRWSVTSPHGITLRAVHRPWVENRRADLLNRWKQDSMDLKLEPGSFDRPTVAGVHTQ